jgi:uncharacterized protein YjbI with pentapeptide repeats
MKRGLATEANLDTPEFQTSCAGLSVDKGGPAHTVNSSRLTDLLSKDGRLVDSPIRIANAVIKGPLDFRYATFPCELYITDSVFNDEVDFSFCNFKCVTSFEGSVFKKGTTFRASHAESYLSISRCAFLDSSVFLDLRVDENLYADSSKFRSADFTRASVSKAVFFRPYNPHYSKPFDRLSENRRPLREGGPVEFVGEVFFDDACFGGTAEFQGARFRGRARFEGIHIGGSIFFYPYGKEAVCFEGEAKFNYADIGRNAYFGNATFMSGADFEGLRVGGYALWGSYLEGPGSFLEALQSRSAGLAEYDDLSGTEHSTPALVEKANPSLVSFCGKADFTRVRLAGPASFRLAHFKAEAKFDGAECQGPVDFRGAVFDGPLSLREARLRSILFNSTPLGVDPQAAAKQFGGSIDLRGLTYELINGNWRELLIEGRSSQSGRATYSRQPYSQMEKVLRAVGHDREADNVYLARRRRECRLMWALVAGRDDGERLPIRQRARRLNSALFDILQRLVFNYGIRPLRLLYFSAVVLLIGVYMFAQPGAVQQRERDERKAVETLSASQAFGLSCRLFIPVVDLPTGQQWTPTENPAPHLERVNLSFAGYAALHRLAGAILVPLGIAALTGLMHRRAKP